MKTVAMDFFGEVEEQSGGITVEMDIDDVDSSLDLFGEGPVLDLHRMADSDFFASFQDNFDDEATTDATACIPRECITPIKGTKSTAETIMV